MESRATERIESAIDGVAAVLFAAAAAFAGLRALESVPLAVPVAAAAFLGAMLALRSVQPERPLFAIAGFQLQPVPEQPQATASFDEPVADRSADELLLDDVLPGPCEDSRVVRLFDPAAMPDEVTGSRFNPDFNAATAVPPPADASQALHDALAKLRHSLR